MVKRILFPALFLVAACNDSNTFKKAEDATDAGRQFIRASLDGNAEKASAYLYTDSTNKMMFDKWERDYDHMSPEEKQNYKDAEIRIIDIHPINDSATTFTYANSYKNDTTTIGVVRIKGEWLVDLKEILRHQR